MLLCSASPLHFFFKSSSVPRDLHSFPTRRSSDLPWCFLSLLNSRRNSEFPLAKRSEIRYTPRLSFMRWPRETDRKSTRLNSSHEWISYAVFCLKKKRVGRGHGHLPDGHTADCHPA